MSVQIRKTTNYRMFQIHDSENRPLDIKKHKRLNESMRLYGFLPCFPVVVVKDDKGMLIVKDGQHRLAIAEESDQPVYYIETDVDFDVAVVNSTAKIWQLADYAQKYLANGLRPYGEGMDFARQHGLPLGPAFALLAGTTSFGNINRDFVDGKFKIKDRVYADAVAGVYAPLMMMAPALKNARFLEACMAVCRVKDFDNRRLLENAERRREVLVPYSTRDAYLDMMEKIYNFGRKQLVGLKAQATMAMRERNVVTAKKKKKAQEPVAVPA